MLQQPRHFRRHMPTPRGLPFWELHSSEKKRAKRLVLPSSSPITPPHASQTINLATNSILLSSAILCYRSSELFLGTQSLVSNSGNYSSWHPSRKEFLKQPSKIHIHLVIENVKAIPSFYLWGTLFFQLQCVHKRAIFVPRTQVKQMSFLMASVHTNLEL